MATKKKGAGRPKITDKVKVVSAYLKKSEQIAAKQKHREALKQSRRKEPTLERAEPNFRVNQVLTKFQLMKMPYSHILCNHSLSAVLNFHCNL